MAEVLTGWAALRAQLASVPPGGPIGDAVNRALQNVWTDSGRTKMESHKLVRWESPCWDPPVLSFRVERHGAVVRGSINASVQDYVVDVEREQIDFVGEGTRRIRRPDKALDTGDLAATVADAIVSGRAEPWLHWYSADDVQIRVGALIPATNQQTTTARRRRFANAVGPLLEEAGWTRGRQAARWVRNDVRP